MLLLLSKVYKVNIWMWNFGARTAKPTTLWSSSSMIQGFWSPRKFDMKKYQQLRDKDFQPCKPYYNRNGKKCWKGTSDLKKTGRPALDELP